MTENLENKPPNNAMRQLTSTEQDAHNLGIDLADNAFLHDAGTEGITAERLQENWKMAYMLGRNGVEHALGAETPYAADRVE